MKIVNQPINHGPIGKDKPIKPLQKKHACSSIMFIRDNFSLNSLIFLIRWQP